MKQQVAHNESSATQYSQIKALLSQPDTLYDYQALVSCIEPKQAPQCSFWVGLAKEGPLKAKDLSTYESIPKMLEAAVEKGLVDQEGLMLVNTQVKDPFFVYLLPYSHTSLDLWLDKLVTTLLSWAPEKIGFYVSFDHFSSATYTVLLEHLFYKLITQSQVGNFYVLNDSEDRNRILAMMHQIRRKLEKNSIFLGVIH